MNRLEFTESQSLAEDETYVAKERGVKLYDGDEKTGYEDGEVVLTTHRMFWSQISRGVTFSMSLSRVDSLYEEWASANLFGKKKRLIVRLSPMSPNERKLPGPRDHSGQNFIKLSTKSGVNDDFINSFRETVNAKIWDANSPGEGDEPPLRNIKLRSGITGIERSMQEKQKFTEESVSIAFQDLSKLMAMAQEMTSISKSISNKIKDRQGEISDDDTVKFKVSSLLRLKFTTSFILLLFSNNFSSHSPTC